jgi:hypothetical protein
LTVTATTTITLATGEAVDSTDPKWRDECFARWERVLSARGKTMGYVRKLLADVELAEGQEARLRLESALREDLAARRGGRQ